MHKLATDDNACSMPITALPPNAVRAIGSSQALSDSASVVKELIDNAIDGRATNISIELFPNTLDEIRVKDNGHGIAPDDRVMICTKYCTSKIRDLHDLENIGGRSLGFRGEALASVAEMSGSLTIITRIDGEGTAVELSFDRKGQILGYVNNRQEVRMNADSVSVSGAHLIQWEPQLKSGNFFKTYPFADKLLKKRR